ncbi:MAG: hypothetical protein U0836_19250 [Pirellulales bacterium]
MWKEYYNDVMRWVTSLDKQESLLMLVVVTIVGFFCMRGFGSRSNY